MTTTTPSLGDILYLCSCAIQLDVESATTPPDTPNQYSAGLKVMGDAGDMNLDAVMGAQGPDGQPMFAIRDATQYGYAPVANPSDLPTLDNLTEHIGLYFLIDVLDDLGHVLEQWCYVWWGSYYRQIMMGTVGEPGPVPDIDLDIQAIAPDASPQVIPSGPTLSPSWEFLVPSPAGAPGKAIPFMGFPDFDEINNELYTPSLVYFTGEYTDEGYGKWAPFNIDQLLPHCYSVPETAFASYAGVSQQPNIGIFEIPAQPYDYSPIVWGHIGGAGVSLSTDPFMIGAQVLIDDAVNGQQIARGLGNTMGVVNIMPHYSSGPNPNGAISPINQTALIAAGTPVTLYVNLYNDGALGSYNFTPADTQLFVMTLPMVRESAS